MKRKSNNFIAFDLGSSKIAAATTHIDRTGQVNVQAQALHGSAGIKSGMIVNMEAAESSIVSTIYALEKNCDRSVQKIAISLSGANVKSFYASQKIKVSGPTISKFDMKKLLNKTLSSFKIPNMEIIHYWAIEYKIDNNQLVENPIDLCSNYVECHMHIVAADSNMIANLIRCFSKHQVEVEQVMLAVYASALSTLTADELEVGATIIDMGASTTSYGVISKGKLIYTNIVPVGGNDITLSLAKEFSLSVKEAEKLKILHGNASPDLVVTNNIIDLAEQNRAISSKQVANIVSAMVENIFGNIKAQCHKMALNDLSAQQVVITGGAASMSGLKHCASKIFQKQIRIAKPQHISGFVENYNPLSQAAIIGMIKCKASEIHDNNAKLYHEDQGVVSKLFSWLKSHI